VTDRLITVAIHTYDRALTLKALLEHEGVNVSLQNVNLSSPVVSSGVRVRIKESDLPLALRIIENQDIFNTSTLIHEKDARILVPVDFSDYSQNACNIAFHLAYLHKASIILLHSFLDPAISEQIQLSDNLNFDNEISNRDTGIIVEHEAKRQMSVLTDILLAKIKSGDIPPVRFTTEIEEGIPEEVIIQYAKNHNPLLLVMGTRGAGSKVRDLIGSVTAEVLDTCRFPVFTVPETVAVSNVDKIRRVVFFSNFDQEDILALDALFHLVPSPSMEVTLVKIPSKKHVSNKAVSESLDALQSYCISHYPAHKFRIDTLSLNSLDSDYNRITDNAHIDLIAVPNKKKNIFARLFNPGTAHRLLFHSDIPMMVIPV